MAKPVNESGNYCPLWRKACGKVCHTCELWHPLEVTENGKVYLKWRCGFIWPTEIQAISNHKIDGMGRATEQMRNQLLAMRTSFAKLIGAVAGVRGMIDRAPGPTMALIEVPDAEPPREG